MDNLDLVENFQPLIYKLISSPIQSGGISSNVYENQYIFFEKISYLFLILLISIILAILVTSSLVKFIFPLDDSDNNFDDSDADMNQRWKNIIKYTAIFIAIVILFHCLIIFLVFVLLYIKAGINKAQSPFTIAFKNLIELVWEYKPKGDDNIVSLFKYYYMLLFFVLIVMFIFFIFYTKIVNNYFNNIYYENVYDSSNPDSQLKDKPQPVKYLYQYAIFIILMMIFVLLLLNYSKLFNIKIVFIYNLIILILYLLLSLSVLRYILENNIMKIIIFLSCLILIILLYREPIKLILKIIK